MKKLLRFFLLVFISMGSVFGQVGYDRIFVVDISGSMLQNDLYKRVQKTLIDYIKGCRPGDRVILMTFGTDVNAGLDDRVLYESSIGRDIEALASSVSKLSFKDDWTWMTKAFDVIGNRLRDLQKAYPDRHKRVYVFTDGLNDPPPGKRDFLSFEDVLKAHYFDFKREGTFVYLILLDTTLIKKMDKPTKEFTDSIGIKPVSRERDETILYQEIAFSPPTIEKSLPFDRSITIDWELEVTRMMNVSETKVYFVSKEIPQGLNAVLSPETIRCSAPGQKIPMRLQLSNITEPKTYKIVYSPTPVSKERTAIVIDPLNLVITLNLSQVIVELNPKAVNISANVNESKTKFGLTFRNDKSQKNINALISIQSKEPTKTLRIEPSQFTIPQGENKIEFQLEYNGFAKGNYKYNINLESLESDVKLEPSQIVMGLKLFEPINPIFIVLLVIVLLVIAFVIFALVRIHNIFGKWVILTGDSEGIPLNACKSFFSNQVIIGKDIIRDLGKEILIITANVVTVFTGKLYVLSKVDLSETIRCNTYKELEDLRFVLDGNQIEIKKRGV
ncbi:MAG: vWA domain-containing protein [candidate division WOR-3 bacterium]